MQGTKFFNDYYNDITRKLLERYYDKNPNHNIVFSPFSIISLLTIVAESTDGDTKEELLKLLNGSNK